MVARGVRIIVRQTGDLEARAHIHTHPALDGGGIPGLHDAGRHRDDDVGQRHVHDLSFNFGDVQRHVGVAHSGERVVAAVNDAPESIAVHTARTVVHQPMLCALLIHQHGECMVVPVLACPGLGADDKIAVHSAETVA